jgi:hypothetical protein
MNRPEFEKIMHDDLDDNYCYDGLLKEEIVAFKCGFESGFYRALQLVYQRLDKIQSEVSQGLPFEKEHPEVRKMKVDKWFSEINK